MTAATRLMSGCAARFRPSSVPCCARQHRAPDQIEDVVQEVPLTIHRVRHTCDRLRPWLAAIGRRRSIELLGTRGCIEVAETSNAEAYETFGAPSRIDGKRARDAKATLGRGIEWPWTYFASRADAHFRVAPLWSQPWARGGCRCPIETGDGPWQDIARRRDVRRNCPPGEPRQERGTARDPDKLVSASPRAA